MSRQVAARRPTVRHPEFEAEQEAITAIYDARDRSVAQSRSSYDAAVPNPKTGPGMAKYVAEVEALAAADQLVLGRLVTDKLDIHVGVRRVRDPETRKPLVASWLAEGMKPFYEATPQNPGTVRLRRQITERSGVLSAITDEIGGTSASKPVPVPRPRPARDDAPAQPQPSHQTPDKHPVPANPVAHVPEESAHPQFSDALLDELDRARVGVMRHVVATIQAEQYRIITAPHDKPLVVQGGPGTGKTVVGLHRAALLAGRHEDIRSGSILVLGPTKALVQYISTVLPSLDVQDVVHLELPALYVGEAAVTGTDSPDAALVKGSAEMATVLKRALRARTGWSGGDLFLKLGSTTLRIPEAEIHETVAFAQASPLPHNDVREIVRERLTTSAVASAERQRKPGRANLVEAASIRRLNTFRNALDRMWPTFTPEALLRGLLGTQSWLTEASEGVLDADSRAAIFRPAANSKTVEPWTAADLFLLDELSAHLDGPPRTFTHVVVDEAQDLSPMQARAIARRCPSRSLTLLGDLAQAGGPWIRDSWDELGAALGADEIPVETLTVSYRVPEPALTVAAQQLPLISPGLAAPSSARPGTPIEWILAEGEGATRSLEHARDLAQGERTVGIIVIPEQLDALRTQAEQLGIDVGDGGSAVLDHPVTVLPVGSIRGLEFDHVIVLDPAAIVAASPYGRRDLYVALTRCTQQLHIVYDELPAGLTDPTIPQADATDQTPEVKPDETESWQDAFRSLSVEDQRLVEDLVRRLARTVPQATAPEAAPAPVEAAARRRPRPGGQQALFSSPTGQ